MARHPHRLNSGSRTDVTAPDPDDASVPGTAMGATLDRPNDAVAVGACCDTPGAVLEGRLSFWGAGGVGVAPVALTAASDPDPTATLPAGWPAAYYAADVMVLAPAGAAGVAFVVEVVHAGRWNIDLFPMLAAETNRD